METKVNLNEISTESRNKESENIDKATALEIVNIINNADKEVPLAIEKQSEQIANLIEQTYKAVINGGRVVYIGAGTSGRMGVLDASEMPPTYGVDDNVFVGIIAGGDYALRNAVENAEDSKELAVEDLKKINFNDKDILIGIAASGRTPYVIGGLDFAKSLGAVTGSISTTEKSVIGEIADYPVNINVGPEVITGSTRMKSGTAQKLVLNMISTATMVKLGKVYGNLMIDVKPSNEKLVERAINIVQQTTNVNYEVAKEALERCGYSAKVATVMIWKDVDADEAKELIRANDGKIGGIE